MRFSLSTERSNKDGKCISIFVWIQNNLCGFLCIGMIGRYVFHLSPESKENNAENHYTGDGGDPT